MNHLRKTKNSGYTLVEIIFYIAFFAVLSVVVIDSILVMMKSFKETAIQETLAQGGSVMERISREVKQANDINFINTSSLELKTKDEAGADKTIDFSLTSDNAQLTENGVITGNLNSANLRVNDLSFTQIDTNKGKAVKIFLGVSAISDNLNRVEDFYDTIILRGGYSN